MLWANNHGNMLSGFLHLSQLQMSKQEILINSIRSQQNSVKICLMTTTVSDRSGVRRLACVWRTICTANMLSYSNALLPSCLHSPATLSKVQLHMSRGFTALLKGTSSQQRLTEENATHAFSLFRVKTPGNLFFFFFFLFFQSASK